VEDGRKRSRRRPSGGLPPGQSLTIKWPVLHYGSVPHFDAAKWDFKISGLVETPLRPDMGRVSRAAASGIPPVIFIA